MQAATHYFDRHFEIDAVKLLPGEYYVTRKNLLLVTVLGSCVAACIADPLAKVAGMNHFMLPGSASDSDGRNPLSLSARYGTFAMETLINQLIKAGASRDRLVAKVFGGGAVLGDMNIANIGERNAHFVHDFLYREGIAVAGEDLCGPYPRKVYFFADTGRVLVKVMRRLHNQHLLEREREYARHLSHEPVAGDVELF
jgi:chemotaxis protein CheD